MPDVVASSVGGSPTYELKMAGTATQSRGLAPKSGMTMPPGRVRLTRITGAIGSVMVDLEDSTDPIGLAEVLITTEEGMTMAEKTGKIVFINSHEYVSDVTGEKWVGCLAAIRHDGGETTLYTESVRLQHTLEMAYATARKVTVSYWDKPPKPLSKSEPIAQALAGRKSAGEMYIVKAIWTME